VTDSSCDLPQTLADELGIEIVPLTIRFGDDDFIDRRHLTTRQFWERCAGTNVLPSTAAPSPGQFEEAYRLVHEQGATGIVCITLSGELSATIQSAQLAAAAVDAEVPVRVVDSHSVTLGLGMLVVEAARQAAAGASIDEVVASTIERAARTHVWGALDTLENLKKGGRIGGAKALLASVLSIKPIIEVRNGKVEEGGKQRTRTKALAFLIQQVRDAGPIEQLAVMHADTKDIADFVQQLRAIYSGEIIVGDIGAVIGAHAGLGTTGVVYQVKG
jgi:DegV family protein with EDD domain